MVKQYGSNLIRPSSSTKKNSIFLWIWSVLRFCLVKSPCKIKHFYFFDAALEPRFKEGWQPINWLYSQTESVQSLLMRSKILRHEVEKPQQNRIKFSHRKYLWLEKRWSETFRHLSKKNSRKYKKNLNSWLKFFPFCTLKNSLFYCLPRFVPCNSVINGANKNCTAKTLAIAVYFKDPIKKKSTFIWVWHHINNDNRH